MFQEFQATSESSVISSLNIMSQSLQLDSPQKLKEWMLLLQLVRETFLLDQSRISFPEAKILLRFFKGEMMYSTGESSYDYQVQDFLMFLLSNTDFPILHGFLDHMLGEDKEFWFEH